MVLGSKAHELMTQYPLMHTGRSVSCIDFLTRDPKLIGNRLTVMREHTGEIWWDVHSTGLWNKTPWAIIILTDDEDLVHAFECLFKTGEQIEDMVVLFT